MINDGIRHAFIQRRGLARDTKSPVGCVPPCPTGDLCQLIRGKVAHAATIKLAQTREGHVFDIQI